jgi:hypothetical protein
MATLASRTGIRVSECRTVTKRAEGELQSAATGARYLVRDARRDLAFVTVLSHFSTAHLGQEGCFTHDRNELRSALRGRESNTHWREATDMELKTSSSRNYRASHPVNECAQCRETIFLPEWSEYLDARRVRHLWECEACGYKFETLVCFPEL